MFFTCARYLFDIDVEKVAGACEKHPWRLLLDCAFVYCFKLIVTRTLVWNFGKLLQLVALLQAPYALYLGLAFNDARMEMKYLGLAVVQFLLGLMLVKWSATAEA